MVSILRSLKILSYGKYFKSIRVSMAVKNRDIVLNSAIKSRNLCFGWKETSHFTLPLSWCLLLWNFEGDCKSRLACTYVQSNLDLHSPLLYRYFLWKKYHPMPCNQLKFQSSRIRLIVLWFLNSFPNKPLWDRPKIQRNCRRQLICGY